jgi:hypothetical protein
MGLHSCGENSLFIKKGGDSHPLTPKFVTWTFITARPETYCIENKAMERYIRNSATYFWFHFHSGSSCNLGDVTQHHSEAVTLTALLSQHLMIAASWLRSRISCLPITAATESHGCQPHSPGISGVLPCCVLVVVSHWLLKAGLSLSHVTTDGQPVSQSWCRVPSRAHDQMLRTVRQLRFC